LLVSISTEVGAYFPAETIVPRHSDIDSNDHCSRRVMVCVLAHIGMVFLVLQADDLGITHGDDLDKILDVFRLIAM
jgi:hypothetical protein